MRNTRYNTAKGISANRFTAISYRLHLVHVLQGKQTMR